MMRVKSMPPFIMISVMVGVTFAQERISNITAPSFFHTGVSYSHAVVGQEVLLSCLAGNLGNLSLIWKKVDMKRQENLILAVNSEIVTTDERVSVVHTPGGEVFGLEIVTVTKADEGMFLCEINTDPVETSFHLLTVREIAENGLTRGYQESEDLALSDCCMTRNISLACDHLCSSKTIISGIHKICSADYTDLLDCMVDGKDHMPCCMDAGIPEACTPMCRGQIQTQTNHIKSMFSCAEYAQPILACVVTGKKTLPSRPGTFSAEAMSDSSILVKWSKGKDSHHITEEYKINVTFVHSFSPTVSESLTRDDGSTLEPSSSVVYKLPKDKEEFVFTNLRIFSLYEVSMWAENINGGKSLPTYKAKVITHIQEKSSGSDLPVPDLHLPDIRSCCIQNNVSSTRCLDTFCDPQYVGNMSRDDLLTCTPWHREMFQCVADGKDHTPCCSQRRVPPLCQELCSGNEINITFEYLNCLAYMSEISSCMIESYKLLPSSPVNFRVSNIHSDFAVLHWDRPEELGETAVDYVVRVQKVTLAESDEDDEIYVSQEHEQTIKDHAHNPFVLENLDGDSSYEVIVEAVNAYGVGEPSTAIVFRTISNPIQDLLEKLPTYDPSSCCLKSGINPECAPLCSYNATIPTVISLSHTCQKDFSKLIRCSAAGRNHLPCCARRGISSSCLPLCQAVHQASTGADFWKCLPQIGQIFTCFEEGVLQLPPPVRDFKAVSVGDGVVTLSWGLDPSHDEFDQYEVFYKKTEEGEVPATVLNANKRVNTTVPTIKISGLEVGRLYSFYCASKNEKGSSLPSSIVSLNVSSAAWQGREIFGASSPPHILSLDDMSPTDLTFSWNPPAISHPEDLIKYRVYYRDNLDPDSKQEMQETDITHIKLEDLIPNTRYQVYVKAVTVGTESEVESSRSENLLAWTDLAIPANVQAPVIEPAKLQLGSNMTVHCIAMGIPIPRVTLYINGIPLKTEITQHLVTVVQYLTSDMDHVSCYADNGYGDAPMITSQKITINRAPLLSGPELTTATSGDTVTMQCTVVAFPAPVMALFSDEELEHSVSVTERVAIIGKGDDKDYRRFFLRLTIQNVSESDGGDYYCHAKNTLGQESIKMELKLSSEPHNVMECCTSKNISTTCLDICRFSLDLDYLIARPHCLPQIANIISCAKDGSDFSPCCAAAGVPRRCQGWCRGQTGEDVCELTHAHSIVDCFHGKLGVKPDMPVHLKVTHGEGQNVRVSWKSTDPRAKLYRVFWKPVDGKESNIVETKDESIVLTNLKRATKYIVRVKAASSNLTSELTDGLTFKIPDKPKEESSPVASKAKMNIPVVLASLSVLCLVVLVLVLVIRKKKIVCIKERDKVDTTVGFENPSFRSPACNKEGDMRDEDGRIHIRQQLSGMDWSHPDREMDWVEK